MSSFTKAIERVDLDAQTNKIRAFVSPSQVETWDQCSRKWMFAYIFGLKTPPSPGQASGTELHTECEHTSNTRGEVRDTKWKAVVQKALAEGLILIGDEIKNETWIEIPTYPDGPTMRGKYDAVDFGQRPRTGDIFARLVNDYKSTKDFRWNKTPAELAKNIQLTTYGMAVLNEYADDTHLALRHTYLRTQGAASVTKVEVVVPRIRIIREWQKTKEHIRGMQQLAKDLPRVESAIASVTPTLSHCSAFGGCPYLSMCGLGNETFSFDQMATPKTDEKKESTMGLLEDMLNGTAGKKTAAPQVVVATPQVAVVADGQCVTCKGRRYVPNPAKDAALGSFVPCQTCKNAASSITSPDQPPRDAVPAPVVAAPEASEPTEAPKAKRGRPKKEAGIKITVEQEDGTVEDISQSLAEAEAVVTVMPAMHGEPEASIRGLFAKDPLGLRAEIDGRIEDYALAPMNLNGTIKKLSAKTGIAIYIDCLPQKGEHSGEGIDYLEWLAPVAERVAREKKVADWRIIPFSAEGELAAAIHATIKNTGLPPVVLVSGNSRARAPFLEVAGMFASTVIVAVGR